MATEIKMPQLSDTMSSGKILLWKKSAGDLIKRGDILAEVETDKANLEIESFFQGTLLKVLTPAGGTAKVGEVIAVLGGAGEALTTPPSAMSSPTGSEGAALPPASLTTPAAPAPSAPSPSAQPQLSSPAQRLGDGERVRVSPLARRIASQSNVDLTSISGSGPEGRIVRKDIEQAAARAGQSPRVGTPRPVSANSVPADSTKGYQNKELASAAGSTSAGTLTPLSRMRETIARRMQESVNQSPHFYTTVSIDMEQAFALRAALKERPDYKGLSVNHLVIKAAAYALKNEPRVNRAFRDGCILQPAQINIGVITAIEDGLLIPVIREADLLPLHDLVFEAKAAIERARAGRPNAGDLTGGTFSISNMGMFNVENFTAIINPGQGAVLAVSSTLEVPVVKRGVVVSGLQMKATLSVDHRVIDGLMSISFMKFFKEGLELPGLLLT